VKKWKRRRSEKEESGLEKARGEDEVMETKKE
jgi:hypothetical protein